MKPPVRNCFPRDIALMKREICRIGALIWQRGFVSANDGNISVRAAADRWLCTPTGVSKGFMRPEMICLVNEKSEQVSGQYKLTSEIRVHIALALQLPAGKCGAVVHTHAPHATAFALVGKAPALGILPEVEVQIGKIGFVPYETPGSWALARQAAETVRPDMGAMILASHGLVTWGATLEEAYFRTEIVDNYCRLLILTKQLGRARVLPRHKRKELLRA